MFAKARAAVPEATRFRSVRRGEVPDPISVGLFLSGLLFLMAIGAQFFVAWRYWATTWDDSAITLGFARTFAQTGRIEPTPGSGIVEGYSTTLWMLIMALASKVIPGPTALLATAKLATLGLNVANLLLMRRWFASWLVFGFASGRSRKVANLIAGSVGCQWMFTETINGMETPLILVLVLSMLLVARQSDRAARGLYLLLGVALLLTRWEAAWLLVPFVLVEGTLRGAIRSSSVWMTAFLGSNVVRWAYFGSILPNTIMAKRGVPYSRALPPAQQVLRHLVESKELLLTSKKLFLVVACSVLVSTVLRGGAAERPSMSSLRGLRARWEFRFTCVFTLFVLLLTTLIGPNWGPPYRSFYEGWPFLFALLLLPLVFEDRRVVPWATGVLCLLACGRLHQQLVELGKSDPPYYMADATVGDISLINGVLSRVREAAHKQDLLVAEPDMGGVMLFGEHTRLIDLGLLCDPVLARRRYAAVQDYVLEQRRPDVIEVHAIWTGLTGLRHIPVFARDYLPVYVDGSRLFLRRELVASIDRKRLVERAFDDTGEPAEEDRKSKRAVSFEPEDLRLNKEFGSYLELY